ncbi:hypothetical protein ALI144C_21670 [Actinosynnema sp. ALI-1.44]|nr:hypothetical protein ALI144C_21670 [Actinosynnema sp. ALI-1.44]
MTDPAKRVFPGSGHIAIKSGKDEDGRAITCDSEWTAGIRNAHARKSNVIGGTECARCVKSDTKRGGFSQNINLGRVPDALPAFLPVPHGDVQRPDEEVPARVRAVYHHQLALCSTSAACRTAHARAHGGRL